jgi:hypothetical protein
MTNKRNRNCIESEKSKVSPPSKMPRGGFNPSGASSRQFTLNDVMEKLDKIEGDFSKVWKKFEEVDDLKREVKELRKTHESFKRFEIEQKKRSILIKGLASRSSEKYETKKDTKLSLDEMFNFLQMTPNLDDYQRLGELKKDETENTMIRVKFASFEDKIELFKRFKERGNENELKKISLITDYPLFQLAEVKHLSQVAYDIRKASKGTKTRIVPRGLGLALQKKESDGRWMNVSPQNTNGHEY